jgi:hypothetical protein
MKARGRSNKMTKEQIELGAKWLAMSNMCMLDGDQYLHGNVFSRGRTPITDLKSLESAVEQAIDRAVGAGIEGYSMEAGRGYDDRFETKAIRDVEREIKAFRADLNAGGDRAKYFVETLKKEVPCLFELAPRRLA